MKDITRKIINEDANKVLDWIFETPIFDEDNWSGLADDHHQVKIRNLTLIEARAEALKRFKELNKKEIYEDEVIGFWIANEEDNFVDGWFSIGFKYPALARKEVYGGRQNKSWIIDINR